MAAILIGASALAIDKIREKRKAKKVAQREYDEHFEQLMAANASRVRNISQSSTDMPPSYDEIVSNANRPKQSTASEHDQALQQPLQFRHQVSGRATTLSPSDRVERRDMAAR